MHVAARSRSRYELGLCLATVSILAGSLGMVVSFVFLASAHYLDVVAGGHGFVAGALLLASGVVSFSVLGSETTSDRATTAVSDSRSRAFPPAVVRRWIAHFHRNRENRSEPHWQAPVTLARDVIRPLVHSLEQFQLGDGGGPAQLIAWNADKLRHASAGTRELVDLWFAEEREHARLLGQAVARFGGQPISRHWSFTAFCQTRRWLGVRFELTVLLLTEIVSTAYYRLLRRHGQDPALTAMCSLILRDEAGHIAFHRDRLAHSDCGRARFGRFWAFGFRTLGFAAATMLWVNHAAGLRAVGATRSEFYREVGIELSRFVRRIRRHPQ